MSLDASFEDTPVTATVSPAPEAAASATADAWFGDLGAPVQPSAPTPNTVAGTSNDPDADLDARAGGLLANKSATDRNAISAFMRAVVPWPGENDPGFVNLHFDFMPNPKYAGKKSNVSGYAFKTVDGFCKMTKYLLDHQERYRNIWQCMSLQRESAGANKTGNNYMAKRIATNAIGLKALWVDFDLKDPAKDYTTEQEAVVAVLGFCKKHKLPSPSCMVASGNGLHMYWASNKALTLEEWKPLAEGFKALLMRDGIKIDPVCTADAARLMRLPETFNRKDLTNPKPVKLLNPNAPIPEYDFSTKPFQDLKQHYTPVAKAPPRDKSEYFEAAAFAGKRPSPVFKGIDVSEKLSDGISRLLDHKPIFDQCPMYDNAYKTGGVGLSQGLWMLQVLGTTFMEGGDELAHAISEKHADYAKVDTNAMFSRKMAERDSIGFGYPSCASFKSAGCTACEGCPIFQKGKSPLNIRPAVNAAAADANSSASSPGQGDDAVRPNWPDPLDFHRVPIQEAVARVNAAGYFVLTLNGDIYKVEPGGGVIVQKRDGFNNLFACRKALPDNPKNKGNEDKDKDKSISAGEAWKRSPQRHEYDSIGYWPGGYHCPAKSYNLWQGWGVEPTQGDWSVINDHVLDVLACGDKAKSDYILDWCAHMVQRPWEKPGVALVFRGGKGTGKTLLTLLVATAIGRRNTLITASGKKLFGTFNWQLADKLLIGAEEAFFVGNRELNDQLKHLLTGDDIEVEQKFGQRISMKSMHRMIMTSNHDQVISASDDERRFFVCDVSETRRGDDSYFAPLVAITKSEDNDTLAAFMYELQTRDIKNWKPERAARKAASGGSDLARQKLLSLEPPLQWLLERTVGTSFDADRKRQRADMLMNYREWVKTAQVRGASEYTGAETFWNSIKRLLKEDTFPGQRLFLSSNGTRWVILPPRQELLDGFNRLLGGKVIDADEDE